MPYPEKKINRIFFQRRKNGKNNYKDIFHSYLLKNAEYDGEFEIPRINPCFIIPNRLIPFSKISKTKDFNQWVHFYEDDYKFNCIWNNPNKYINLLKKFNGVITPDFSLYRNMPISMQIWNTFRGKALGYWWQNNGLNVIPNVRSANESSYRFCCDGISTSSTISIGSHGCIKKNIERSFFINGLKFIVERLNPSCIIFYGAVTKEIEEICNENKIKMVTFSSDFMLIHKKGGA